MRKIIAQLKRFFYWVFPIVENKLAKKKIKKIIEDIEEDFTENKSGSKYIKEYVGLKRNELEGFFNLSLEIKNILEDKAKGLTLIFTITVSVLLGTGAFFGKNLNGSWLALSGLILFSFYAVFNTTIASILILETLSDLNKVYYLSPEDTKLGAKRKEVAIAFNTVLNYCYNHLRSNNLYTVYKSITKTFISLFFLVLFFILASSSEKKEISKLNNSLDSLRAEFKYKNEIYEDNQKRMDSLGEKFEQMKKEFLKIKKE